MARKKLGEILIQAGVLTKVGLNQALKEQQRWGGQLGRYLVELGHISEETLVRALSTQYKLPAVALEPSQLSIETGRIVPQKICEKYNLICFRVDLEKRFLDLAMSNPSNNDAVDEVRVATKFNVRPHIAAPTIIDKAISHIFYRDPALSSFEEVSLEDEDLINFSPEEKMPRRSPTGTEATPVHKDMAKEPWSPGVTTRETDPSPLEVNVLSTPPFKSSANTPRRVNLPPPVLEDNFHITLDVPVVGKPKPTAPDAEDRLKLLEATVARNSSIIQATLEVMLKKGLLTQDEILHIISMSPR